MKMLVGMLHVGEVIEQRLPSFLKLGAALATVSAVLTITTFGCSLPRLCALQIQPVEIERDRQFAK
jgi:hypothetical protein